MNGYANFETNAVAFNVLNIESLYLAARRLMNGFSLRNLYADAIAAGMVEDIDLENVEFDQILDSVLEG